MKKILIILFIILFIEAGILFLLEKSMSPDPDRLAASNLNCPFCNEQIIERQKFYENDYWYAFCDKKPIKEGHCLILPKRHVTKLEDLSETEYAAFSEMIKKVHSAAQKYFQTGPYLILQKNGTEVGQTVAHLHFHYVPRKTGEKASLPFLYKFFFNAFSSPLSEEEIKEKVSALKEILVNN